MIDGRQGGDVSVRLGNEGEDDGIEPSEEEFVELYRRWRPDLVRLCRRLLEAGDAEDVAQEAFLRAWLAREQYSPTRPFWPWLATIARRLCLDQRRRRGRELIGSHEAAEEPADTTPEHLLELDEDAALVGRVLESLRPAERRALLHRELDGWSYGRIAAAEGRTVEAVRSSLKRARASLRVLLPADSFELLATGADGLATAGREPGEPSERLLLR